MRLDQALVRDKRWSNFELLCISKPRSKLPLGFGGKALVWLVDALKDRQEGCPDFILIDCPAGIDAGFITAITPANEALLVTTPDITSLRDADRVTGLLECDGIKDIKMIVNRVRTDMIKGEDMMSVLDVQEMLGLALLGVIPEDSEVIRSTNRGYPLVLNKPPTLAGLAFEQAAWRLVEQDSMQAVMVEEEPKKKGIEGRLEAMYSGKNCQTNFSFYVYLNEGKHKYGSLICVSASSLQPRKFTTSGSIRALLKLLVMQIVPTKCCGQPV
ncbi:unnamed protein product [Thlaspi arvense]|uniref:Uncharacterized protein n=1 Tax=Thlaspi arvense TaxID=13288 RepID=A0AAU9T5Q8_THLAR|nr:unnamed protein product [Thlaspi arvense]